MNDYRYRNGENWRNNLLNIKVDGRTVQPRQFSGTFKPKVTQLYDITLSKTLFSVILCYNLRALRNYSVMSPLFQDVTVCREAQKIGNPQYETGVSCCLTLHAFLLAKTHFSDICTITDTQKLISLPGDLKWWHTLPAKQTKHFISQQKMYDPKTNTTRGGQRMFSNILYRHLTEIAYSNRLTNTVQKGQCLQCTLSDKHSAVQATNATLTPRSTCTEHLYQFLP